MKCYLNRGAFKNRAAPTFDDADMQKVITLGKAIIASGKYTLMPIILEISLTPTEIQQKESLVILVHPVVQYQ